MRTLIKPYVIWHLVANFVCGTHSSKNATNLPATKDYVLANITCSEELFSSTNTSSDDTNMQDDNTPLNVSIEDDGRRNYDTDFNKFMKKMFTSMPLKRDVTHSKDGPNVGYRPYWYGYDTKGLDESQPHQSWDYGLDLAIEKSIWGTGKKVLLSGMLGASSYGGNGDGDHSKEEVIPTWHPNMGPTGVLGKHPDDLTDMYLDGLREKTTECGKCDPKYANYGVVCAVYENNKYLEMDMCMMLKMNCLGGEAYVDGTGRLDVFALKEGWGRFAVKATRNVRLVFCSSPKVWSWPYYEIRLMSDDVWPNPWIRYNVFMYNKRWSTIWSLYQGYWIEYSVVWSSETGWFLLSQPRNKDWTRTYYLEHTDSKPWEIVYIAMGSYHGWWSQFYLTGLTMVSRGTCEMQGVKYDFPDDTKEMRKRITENEKEFQERKKKLNWKNIHWWKVTAKEGSEAEY